jgi:hypothetical protein
MSQLTVTPTASRQTATPGVSHQTARLLTAGIVAGPLFLAVWAPQAFTRPPQGRRRLRLHPGAWLSPLLATRAYTGEVLHARQRTGRAASGRGAERFVNETAGRIRRAGASGPLQLCAAACRAVGEHWDFGDDRA